MRFGSLHYAPSGVPDDSSIDASGNIERAEILSETKCLSTKQLVHDTRRLRSQSGEQAVSRIRRIVDNIKHKALGLDKLVENHHGNMVKNLHKSTKKVERKKL